MQSKEIYLPKIFIPRHNGLIAKGHYIARAKYPDGTLKWEEEFDNLITNAGLDYQIGVALASTTQITTWYLGLKNAGAPAAGDTMASHAGWTENVSYDEANRLTWTPGAVSGQAVSNSATPVTFTASANGQEIAGAFLVSNNTKSGTTGTLYSVGNFGSVKNLDVDETLELVSAYSVASA